MGRRVGLGRTCLEDEGSMVLADGAPTLTWGPVARPSERPKMGRRPRGLGYIRVVVGEARVMWNAGSAAARLSSDKGFQVAGTP